MKTLRWIWMVALVGAGCGTGDDDAAREVSSVQEPCNGVKLQRWYPDGRFLDSYLERGEQFTRKSYVSAWWSDVPVDINGTCHVRYGGTWYKGDRRYLATLTMAATSPVVEVMAQVGYGKMQPLGYSRSFYFGEGEALGTHLELVKPLQQPTPEEAEGEPGKLPILARPQINVSVRSLKLREGDSCYLDRHCESGHCKGKYWLSIKGVCRGCGNGVCSVNETADSCSADCSPGEAGVCEGACDVAYDAKLACQCDPGCATRGDCCPDKSTSCGQ